MNPVIKALKFRHACKKFDPKKRISHEEIRTIMEAACLSPSSFGMEAWKFLVIESESVRQKLRPAWCSKQCYIALANIMTAAAAMGIDSCPMEGFEKERAEEVLEIDPSEYEVAVFVALGYRAGDQTPRRRHPADQLVTYI